MKLITCILPKGMALPALEAVRERFEVTASNINNARGVGRPTPLRERGISVQSEKEILKFLVAQEIAEEAFEFVYFEAQVGRPHGGIIYMAELDRTTQFELPELAEKA